MTTKQMQVLDELRQLAANGHYPTVRSLADHMETRFHRSERWTDNEIRGLLDRLKVSEHVASFKGDAGEVRWKPTEEAAA